MKRLSLYLIILCAALASCSSTGKRYVIGVSQCSADIWREKQNAEMRMAGYFHDNVELRFAAAYDSDQRQVEQIDSLVASGVDALIVAPNQVTTISPAIDRAYDKGIPVIVFERKTSSKKYTAFVSADNYAMGQQMGEYARKRLNDKGRVLVVSGLKGSSPAIEREKGFVDALKASKGISIVETLQGDWTGRTAYRVTRAWLRKAPPPPPRGGAELASARSISPRGEFREPVDLVFGMNDRTAMGARKAFVEAGVKLPLFCGVDGLPGERGGIRQVRDSIIDASYIYPTHGDRLIDLAVDILEGKPYAKETRLQAAIVTRWNASSLLMQSEEMTRQQDYIDRLHTTASRYMRQLTTQKQLTYVTLTAVLLLLTLLVLLYLYFLQRAKLRDERERMTREQLDFYTEASHQLRTPLTLIAGPLARLGETETMKSAGDEAREMFEIVERNTGKLSELVEKILEGGGLPPTEVLTGVGTQHGASVESIIGTGQSASVASFVGTQHGASEAGESRDADAPCCVPTIGKTGDAAPETTVLVVDDNADVRSYLRTVLSPIYNVLLAEDGREGLETARREVPDLIVSDVMMPVMNGLQFCQAVKDDYVTSHIPVILLTARALAAHQVEGYRVGADAYITKPFSVEVLAARIDNLLRGRELLRKVVANIGDTDRERTFPTSVNDQSTVGRTLETSAPGQGAASAPGQGAANVGKNAYAPSQGAATQAEAPQLSAREAAFVKRFHAVIDEHKKDSDYSVEDIAAEMSLSRVQLYRKVKAMTGSTPVELLRSARLTHARELLSTTDMTVSEVAYASGFSAPSYFTKCYKDEYGTLPSEN